MGRMDIGELQMRKRAGLLQCPQEFLFLLLTGCTYGQLDGDLTVHLFGFDAQYAHAAWQDRLEIHEHARPIEAARVQDGVDKCRPVVELSIAGLGKETFQLVSLS